MTRETEPLKLLIRTAPSQGEGKRKDQTFFLGEPLTMGELQMYRAICLATSEGPISAEQLHKEVFHNQCCVDGDRKNVWVTISRIRDKLGEEEIIFNKQGYLSRRTLIEDNLQLKVNSCSCALERNRTSSLTLRTGLL